MTKKSGAPDNPRQRRRAPANAIDGVLLLDKPPGMTSNAALQAAKRLFNAQKAGHTGTLDPLASGLLPVCFGEATKFTDELLTADKRYRAVVHFGIATATGDREGEVIGTLPVQVTRDQLENALAQFRGEIDQLPPVYSALKYQGRPLHEYARAGIDVPRAVRKIVVHELVLERWEVPYCTLNVSCSKGTYVRTLAEDIGNALGCGAHLADLRRTGVGRHDQSQSITLDQLERMDSSARTELLFPMASLVEHLPALPLTAELAHKLRLGQSIAWPHTAPAGMCRLYDGSGHFFGLGEMREGGIHPRRLVAQRIEISPRSALAPS